MKTNKLNVVLLLVLITFCGWCPTANSQITPQALSQLKMEQKLRAGNPASIANPFSVEYSTRNASDFSYQGVKGPEYGRITSYAFSPQDEGTAFITNYQNQIFKTTDGGITWNPFFSAPNEPRGWVYVSRLSFANPNEPNHLYASVSDHWDAEDQTISDVDTRGLYIIDATTGEVIDVIQHFHIQHMRFSEYDVDPENPDNIVFFSRMGGWYAGAQQTVWKTTDGGENFQMIYNSEDHFDIGIWTVNFHPQNPDIILVGLAGGPMMYDNHGGFQRSVDGGQTWEYSMPGSHITGVSFAYNDPNTIYAVGEHDYQAKILKSIDAGESWTELDNFEILEHDDIFNYLVDIFTSPYDPFTIWAVTILEVLVSFDAGQSWQTDLLFSDDYLYWGGHALAVNPFDTDNVVVGSDFRTIQTFDKGQSWEGYDMKMMDIYGISATTYPDGQSFLHYQSTGSYFSHNLQTNHITDSLALNWFIGADKHIYPDAQTQNRAFVSTGQMNFGMAFYVNDDNFQTGLELVYEDEDAAYLKRIVKIPASDDSYFFVTAIGPWDGPSQLMRAENDFQDIRQLHIIEKEMESIWFLEVDQQNPGVVWTFAAFIPHPDDEEEEGSLLDSWVEHGIYKSTDYGDTWTKMSEGIPAGRAVVSMAINPHNSDNIVVSVSGMGIYLTLDGGQTWLPADGAYDVWEIIFSQKYNDVVFARQWWADGAGILVSVNGGRSWSELPKDVIRDVNSSGLAILDNNDGTIDLYVGTWGSGILKYNIKIHRSLTMNVDMTDAPGFDPSMHQVYVSGTFGEDLNWVEPGTDNQLVFQQVGNTMTYTLTLEVQAGEIQYKYFSDAIAQGWDGGEWEGTQNRSIFIGGDLQTDDIWGQAPVNVADPVQKATLNIFPNPASTVVNIAATTQIMEVEIINITGSTVYSATPFAFSHSFNVSELKTGVYFVRTLTSSGSSVQKVVIRR